MPQNELITLAQAAEDYNVPLFTLYSAKSAGHIPVARKAQPIQVYRADVEAWLEERGRSHARTDSSTEDAGD